MKVRLHQLFWYGIIAWFIIAFIMNTGTGCDDVCNGILTR